MKKPDFRYINPEGIEVEAFQITETSRYQDKLWPDWLNSRMFMTVNGNEDWLVQGSEELKIPQYGWLVNHPSAGIQIVDAFSFEAYDKVVKEVPEELPEAEPEQPRDPLQDPVLTELKVLYEVGEAGGSEAVHKELKNAIARRILWCNCPPGLCEGGDRWSCRQKSPLVT
jgi:hypothetical protein